MDDQDQAACALCGAKVDADAVPSDWIGLEVAGTDAEGVMWWLNEDFCSQAHAAQWLQQPLSRPEPSAPYVMSPKDRLIGLGIASGVGLIFAFSGLGLLTAIRFVVDRV